MTSRPHPGAWIETCNRTGVIMQLQVAPTRGRGSKHPNVQGKDGSQLSPPPGGVDRNVLTG